MPRPIVNHETSQYDDPTPDQLDRCDACQGFYWRRLGHACNARPVTRFYRGLWLAIALSIPLWGVLGYVVHDAYARTNQPHPIQRPAGLLQARHQCPDDTSLVECRAALRRALSAVAWQRHARWAKAAGTSKDVVRDAITWASQRTGVPAWQLTNIAACESHLYYLAHNGQYLGVWQLGATHRADPIFRVVPWMDPYAQAIHVARFIRAHGEGQWQCTSTGGLRW